jgi:TetR/AcrR family transcriptional repressor of lmrAB and yxaGH operons
MSGLLRVQGFHATGLNQIVRDSGAPKGSLYHYFPHGKEQLAAAAIQTAGEDAERAFAQAFASSSSPVAALQAVASWLAGELERSNYRYGCPIATVALEAASTSALIRAACDTAYRSWQAVIAASLHANGVPRDDAADDAMLVLSALEGALILSRTRRDVRPMRLFSERVAALLSSHRTAAKR